MMKEIWNGLGTKLDSSLRHYQPPFAIWWTFWIITSIANQISIRVTMRAETVDELMNSDMINIANGLLEIPAGVFIIIILKKVSEREYKVLHIGDQEDRISLFGKKEEPESDFEEKNDDV